MKTPTVVCLPTPSFRFIAIVDRHLHVLVEEVQQDTVSIHVVLLDVLVFEVGTVESGQIGFHITLGKLTEQP